MNPKQTAAEKAIEAVENGMVVGLGTGTTAYFAIKKLGEKVRGGLQIQAVASSIASENLAIEEGILIVSFENIKSIDITIDGADEVDTENNLIKGGGGALLREKILAANSQKFIVVVDASKLVVTLGKFPLPVEVVPFAHTVTMTNLQKLGCTSKLRMKEARPFITDSGHFIIDCSFTQIKNPEQLNDELHRIPGVVETGLFPKAMVSYVLVGEADGTVRRIGN
jgi:ribose 5-phosphate isomerase A